MMRILLILLITLGCLQSSDAFSQKKNPLDKRYNKLVSIVKDTYPPVKKNQFELTVFSHKKCGRCRKLLELLREKQIPMIVYDLKIPKYGNLMRSLCYKKAGKKNIRIHYPVVITNKEVVYKINNLVKFANEIETKYLGTKIVNKP